MANINNSIFKQYLGTLDEFKAYYAALDSIQQAALSRALVFIHDKEVDGAWNNDGYIFANGKYYTCRESAGLTLNTLLSLIETGDTSGVDVVESDGKLVFTPIIKNELKALTSVGFVESGKIWAARTPIEDILNDIFAKEIWYLATSSTVVYSGVITASIPAPTLNVTVDEVTITGSTTCEIGAPITLSGALQGSTATYKQNFTVTCNAKGSDGSNNNGFALYGSTGYPTSGATTSVSISATAGSTGSDTLSIPTSTGNKSGGFQSAIIDSNQLKFATGATNQYVHGGTNKIEIKSTSKTYTATANPGDTQKYLYTISNKGNYPTADTMDDVDVKQAISKTESVTPTKTSSITITGNYKYYYVWGATSQPNIPTNFNGDLEGWTENWGSKKLYEDTPTALNGYIYILKPTSEGAPKINNEFTQAGEFTKENTTYTNKYGTKYSLYSFSSAGSKYKDVIL